MLFHKWVRLCPPDTVCCCALKKLALVRGPNNSSCTISKLIEKKKNFYFSLLCHAFHPLSVRLTFFYIMKCC